MTHTQLSLLLCLLMWSVNLTLEMSNNGKRVGSFDQCTVPCHPERFDIGKDCVDSGNRCPCVAHCCWAFDCRRWPIFAQCRKKCRVGDWSRFGPSQGSVQCDHFACPKQNLNDWDLRNVEDPERINCIKHCCYAFNCDKFSGYCREMCK